jgi:hypothetical protein
VARCAYCETETELYEGLTPLCVRCADMTPAWRAEAARLFHDLSEATHRADAATEAFATISSDIPSDLPHPDGTQRIRNASRELTTARDELLKAHNLLNEFLNSWIGPEGSKRS